MWLKIDRTITTDHHWYGTASPANGGHKRGVRRSNISWHGATSGARLSECAARQGGAPRLDASILLQLLIIITGFNTSIDFNILYDIFPSTINTIKVSLGKYMNALTPFFGTILSNLRRKNGSKPRLNHTSYWDPFIKPLEKIILPSTMDQSPLYQYKAMFTAAVHVFCLNWSN